MPFAAVPLAALPPCSIPGDKLDEDHAPLRFSGGGKVVTLFVSAFILVMSSLSPCTAVPR